MFNAITALEKSNKAIKKLEKRKEKDKKLNEIRAMRNTNNLIYRIEQEIKRVTKEGKKSLRFSQLALINSVPEFYDNNPNFDFALSYFKNLKYKAFYDHDEVNISWDVPAVKKSKSKPIIKEYSFISNKMCDISEGKLIRFFTPVSFNIIVRLSVFKR